MKRCPFCAEEIQDAAIVCRHCNRRVVDPAGVPWEAPTRPTATVAATAVVPQKASKSGRWVAALIATAVAAIGIYLVIEPYLALNSMRAAMLSGDSAELQERVDFSRLRESLKDQMNTYMAKQMATDPNLKNNPFGGFAMALVPKMVDSMVDGFVTPTGLAALVRGDRPNTSPNASPQPAQAANAPLSDYRLSREGLGRFSIWIKGKDAKETRLVFHRYGVGWKLTDAIIPLDETGASAAPTSN